MRNYINFIRKIHFILGNVYTHNLYKIVLLILFGTILEIFGITLIIPALNFLLNPELTINVIEKKLSSEFFFNLFITIKTYSVFYMGIFIFIFIFFIFTLKFFYLIFVAWLSSKFVLDIQKYVTEKLFTTYINKEYKFYLKSNGSILASTVVKESSVFASTIIGSIIMLLTEGLMIIGCVSLIIIFSPKLSIIILTFSSLIIYVYYTLIKQRVTIWGKKRQDHDALKLKNLYQSFENIKIIKLMGLENFFSKNFFSHNKIATEMDRNSFFLSKIPNIGLEYLVIIILIISVILILISSTDVNELITLLALYAATAFKMMPSINRSLNSLTGLKYGASVVSLIFNELNIKKNDKFYNIKFDDSATNEIKFQNKIELKNINFKYDDSEDLVLDNVSINIFKNDFIGIVGESGSGKTTFLNIFLTLLSPSSGEYFVDKKEIGKENVTSWRKRISFVPQEPYLVDDTLLKNIAFGIDDNLINIQRVIQCLDIAQFSINKKNLNIMIGEKGIKLSGGQKQRISIARALYADPDIIVMDEPTSSLDINTERKIINAINELSKNKTILLVSHRKSVMEKCNKIFEIEGKKFNLIHEDN